MSKTQKDIYSRIRKPIAKPGKRIESLKEKQENRKYKKKIIEREINESIETK